MAASIENEGARPPNGRVRLAQALALVALVAALVGALGPADNVRTTYSWPPAALPEGTPPKRLVHAAPAVRHRPRRSRRRCRARCRRRSPGASVRRPSSRPPASPSAGGLAVTRGDRLGRPDRAGRADRSRARSRSAADGACACRPAARRRSAGSSRAARTWRPRPGARADARRLRPLLARLDLRQGTPSLGAADDRPSRDPAAAASSRSLDARRRLRRPGLARSRRRDARPRPCGGCVAGCRAALAHAHPADAVVGLVLIGLVGARAGLARRRLGDRAGADVRRSGGFSYYYTDFGANLPNDYWLEWAQHWLAESSLLVGARARASLPRCGVGALPLDPRARARGFRRRGPHRALGPRSGFLVGALAWGMTVRPEPFTALFVTASSRAPFASSSAVRCAACRRRRAPPVRPERPPRGRRRVRAAAPRLPGTPPLGARAFAGRRRSSRPRSRSSRSFSSSAPISTSAERRR